MKFWHRGTMKPEYQEVLERWKVPHQSSPKLGKPQEVSYFVVEVDESNPGWPEISPHLKKVFFWTQFSPEEIAAAQWCVVWGRHSIGYFVPKGEWWSKEYYADHCPNCGAGWRQIAPFRIKSEPKLGKNMFSSFGSGFELFCTPLVLNAFEIHRITGYDTWPLILHKKDRPAEALKQIVVTQIAQPAVAEELVERERYSQSDCPVCGRTWHAHYTRGMLPLRKSALIPEVDFQLTHEWFGNGRTARREILVSNRVVKLILENNWKGADLMPIQAVS